MRLGVLPLLAVLLAGCAAPAAEDAAPAAAPGAPPIPAAPEAFTRVLCAGDALVPLEGREASDCNVQVTTRNGPAAEVSLAVNPLDPLNLVGGAKDFSLGEDPRCGRHSVWSGVYWSRDGGRTWGNGLLPGHPKDARRTALSDYACGSDPVLAFGPDGTVYYASLHVTMDPDDPPPVPQMAPVLGYATLNGAVAVTRSRDGGETWDDPVLIATAGPGEILDKEWIAVDARTGHLYVSYLDASGVLVAQSSQDQGETWSAPVALAEGAQFGQIAVTPDGAVHFTYWATRQGDDLSAIYHRSSADGGATWSAPARVADFVPVLDFGVLHKYRVVANPALAADPTSGALYVAYPHLRDNLDVFAVASTDGGETWSAPVRVNDDLAGPQNGQWMPAVAVGPDGTLHATWIDYRDDPRGESAYVYHAFSTDGGRTFSRNARVSDAPFDGTGGYHQSGSGTVGDYMGLAVSAAAVHPFWADTRHGRNDVFAATLPAS